MKVEPKYKIGDKVTVIYFKMSKAKEPIKFVDPYLVDNKITKSFTHVSIIDLKITEIVKCMCEPLEINGKPRKEFTYIAEDIHGISFIACIQILVKKTIRMLLIYRISLAAVLVNQIPIS